MKLHVRNIRSVVLISPILLGAFFLSGCNDDNDENIVEDNSQSETIEKFAIESYARDVDISIEEAEKQLNMMNRSGEINELLAETFGEESLSSVYFIPGKDFGIGVRLSGNNIKYDMKELRFKDGEVMPMSLSNGESFNAQGIVDHMSDVSPMLLESFKGIQSMGYNGESNKLIVDVYEPDVNIREINNLIDLKSISNDMNIEINYVDNRNIDAALPTTYDNKILAGGRFSAPGSCTTGFTGYVNGVPGFLTATHCQDNTFYQGNAIGTFNINPKNAYTNYSPLHEMSFIPTPSIAIYGGIYENPSTFFSSDIKKITGLRDTGIYINNTYLCHFGRSTSKSCGFVKQVNVRNNIFDPNAFPPRPYGTGCSSKYSPDPSIQALSCSESFFKLGSYGSSLACSTGDSGGPVYSSNGKAYGIVSSASFNGPNVGQCESVTFSLIDYAVRDLGFVLKTEF